MPLEKADPAGAYLAPFGPQEQRHKALRAKDYETSTLSIAAKMAANRGSTWARMPGCVKM